MYFAFSRKLDSKMYSTINTVSPVWVITNSRGTYTISMQNSRELLAFRLESWWIGRLATTEYKDSNWLQLLVVGIKKQARCFLVKRININRHNLKYSLSLKN